MHTPLRSRELDPNTKHPPTATAVGVFVYIRSRGVCIFTQRTVEDAGPYRFVRCYVASRIHIAGDS